MNVNIKEYFYILLIRINNRYILMAEYEGTMHPYKRKKNGKRMSWLKHLKVWTEANGEIPKGYIIHHIDGDKKNNNISNLKCINRSEHTLIHSKERKRIHSTGSEGVY